MKNLWGTARYPTSRCIASNLATSFCSGTPQVCFHTFTQVCKYLQSWTSYCSSFVCTLTFCENLHRVCTRFSIVDVWQIVDPIVLYCRHSSKVHDLNAYTRAPLHMHPCGVLLLFSVYKLLRVRRSIFKMLSFLPKLISWDETWTKFP